MDEGSRGPIKHPLGVSGCWGSLVVCGVLLAEVAVQQNPPLHAGPLVVGSQNHFCTIIWKYSCSQRSTNTHARTTCMHIRTSTCMCICICICICPAILVIICIYLCVSVCDVNICITQRAKYSRTRSACLSSRTFICGKLSLAAIRFFERTLEATSLGESDNRRAG